MTEEALSEDSLILNREQNQPTAALETLPEAMQNPSLLAMSTEDHHSLCFQNIWQQRTNIVMT